MTMSDEPGSAVEFEVMRVKEDTVLHRCQPVATEVPFTIIANGTELATLLSTPTNMEEFTCGFLYVSGFIAEAGEIHSYVLDSERWVANVEIERPPDPSIMGKRLFTSGCGKGIMYASVVELSSRRPPLAETSLTREQVWGAARWLQTSSDLYKSTGGVHTAALSDGGGEPIVSMDDIGRHNAVDKVIGWALKNGQTLSSLVLITSGRVSSEILHKAARAGIATIVARGAPTHQAVLRARESGITVIGFARGSSFTVYSHEERIGISESLTNDSAGAANS